MTSRIIQAVMILVRDLIIVLCFLSTIVKGEGFCSGSLLGFTCCVKIVDNPEYDQNGNAYGTENGKSCVRLNHCLIPLDSSKNMHRLRPRLLLRKNVWHPLLY